MATLITDPLITSRIIAQRRNDGIDVYDEVWDGVYVIVSPVNDEHQFFVGRLAVILEQVIGMAGLGEVRPGVNVSDREDWINNYRIPDVAVFLNGTAARNCDEFWLGGPDFAVEVTSPYDKTYEKLPFYARVGVRELLIVNRNAWRLELYRPQGSEMLLVQTATVEGGELLSSELVGLTFRLIAGAPRPRIEVSETIGDAPRAWRM